MTGAEALKRALAAAQAPKRARTKEDVLVDEAFKLIAPVIKGWIRSRVRQGSDAVAIAGKLSRLLTAGDEIVQAAGGIFRAVQTVRKATGR